MIRVTDAISSPPSTSLTAGSRSPSWKISAASVEIEPGTMPPMSFQWAMLAAQAHSRSPAKTGIAITTSFRCVTPP